MPRKTYRILVVDDDARLRALLSRYLSEQGFSVKTAEDGAAMDRALLREHYDLLVLDLMLPGEDGLAICQRLRSTPGAQRDISIIMLTAKGNDDDRIRGLDLGADDYLPKPFNPRELLSRIQAVLRRAPDPTPGATSDSGEIRLGMNVVNLATRQLMRNGEAVPLTTGEFSLLKVLLENPGQPMSREKLAELARGRELGVFDRGIDVQISKLRKLLEPEPARPRYLQTVWGLGYMFVPDDSD